MFDGCIVFMPKHKSIAEIRESNKRFAELDKTRNKDKIRDQYLTNKRKLSVLRLKNEEVMDLSVDSLLDLLKSKGFK